MANLSITNTFTSGTKILASETNTNNTDISGYLNDRNQGSADWDFVSSAGAITIKATTNQLALGTTNVLTITSPAPASSQSYTIPDVSSAADFVMTAGAQTIAGVKTFSGQLIGEGTATDDSASTGQIGEQVRAILIEASRISAAATNTFGNITSISLTAGDWDVTGIIVTVLNSATATAMIGVVSTNTGNTTTDHVPGDNEISEEAPTATFNSMAIVPAFRLTLSGTTTVFLKGRVTFSSGTPQIYGRISARRVR